MTVLEFASDVRHPPQTAAQTTGEVLWRSRQHLHVPERPLVGEAEPQTEGTRAGAGGCRERSVDTAPIARLSLQGGCPRAELGCGHCWHGGRCL